MSPQRLLDVNEIADLLGCSVRTVRRRIADGSLPSVRIGGLRRVSESVIADLYGSHPTNWAALPVTCESADAIDDNGTQLCLAPEVPQTSSAAASPPQRARPDWAALLDEQTEHTPQPVPGVSGEAGSGASLRPSGKPVNRSE